MAKFRQYILACFTIFCAWSVDATAEDAQQHPLESMNPRPSDGIEYLRELGRTSHIRIAGTPVGQVVLDLSTNEQLTVCTGILIDETSVLTARHCLDTDPNNESPADRIEIKAIYFLIDKLSVASGELIPVELRPVAVGKGKLDYLVLRLQKRIDLTNRRIPPAGIDPLPKQDLYIIHHPFGQILAVSRRYCTTTDNPIDEVFFKHVCDTQPSSSGAPIFDENFNLVGIHVKGGRTAKPDSFNEGLLLSSIIKDDPDVAASLKRLGTAALKPGAVDPSPPTLFSFRLADGSIIKQDANGWTLTKTNTSDADQLRLQKGRTDEVVLWNPKDDLILRIPRSGGPAYARKGAEIVWSDIGNAQKL